MIEALPNGWFNNVVVFSNILIDKAQIGFKLAAMGVEISNSTVQNMDVGVWIEGAGNDNKTWNNMITNLYAEYVKKVFKFDNARYIKIDGLFAQGGSQSATYDSIMGFWGHSVLM